MSHKPTENLCRVSSRNFPCHRHSRALPGHRAFQREGLRRQEDSRPFQRQPFPFAGYKLHGVPRVSAAIHMLSIDIQSLSLKRLSQIGRSRHPHPRLVFFYLRLCTSSPSTPTTAPTSSPPSPVPEGRQGQEEICRIFQAGEQAQESGTKTNHSIGYM